MRVTILTERRTNLKNTELIDGNSVPEVLDSRVLWNTQQVMQPEEGESFV